MTKSVAQRFRSGRPGRPGRPGSSPPIETVAAVIERMAVLLGAGVAPASAWNYLAADGSHGGDPDSDVEGGASRIVRAVAARGTFGSAIADSIAESVGAGLGDAVLSAHRDQRSSGRRKRHTHVDRELSAAWLGLASAWLVASESGAPLAPCLRSLAQSFRALGDTQRDLQVALAAPAATAKMVMALPIVGVLFGIGLGFDTLHVLFGTTPGLACLIIGTALMFAGSQWNKAMITASRPKHMTPGLLVDLMAIGMTGGGSLERARALVMEAASRYGVGAASASSSSSSQGSESEVIDEVLDLAQRAGVPAAELLRSEAEQLRRQARSDGQHAAASLAVKLMLPLGLCVLPAFMLVGVAPLLMAVLSSTIASF